MTKRVKSGDDANRERIWEQRQLDCRVESPFMENDLLLTSIKGAEAISRPFFFDLEFNSPKPDLDFEKIVGKTIHIVIDIEDSAQRHLHGYISRFTQGETDEDLTVYRAHLVPWLALLRRRTDARIFQEKSAKEIVEQVFRDAGFTDFEYKATRGNDKREYCVQYNETDLDFVSRLLEEEGIIYWFEHESKKHELVLGDKASHCPKSIGARLEFVDMEGREGDLGEKWKRKAFIHEWSAWRETRSSSSAVSDFSFEEPDNPIEGESKSDSAPIKTLDLFEYPTIHSDKQGADGRAKLRIEIEEAAANRSVGKGSCVEFVAGARFDFEGHANSAFNAEYLLTRVRHTLRQALVGGGVEYSNEFECVKAKNPYRVPIATPRPRIAGVQTATVVGEADQDIVVDEHGRVKVHFHWDRVGEKSKGDCSCWIRVSQLHASGGFGGVSWPRVGDEVVISFEQGNPDRPIITGRLYNAKNKPPYELPANATQSTVKTRSLRKDKSQYNEIRFEDKAGEEHLFIRAQKDRHDYVKDAAYVLVEGEQHRTIVKDDFALYKASRDEEVKRDRSEKVGGKLSTEVTGDRHAKITGGEAVQATTVYIKAATNLVIEAGLKLSLKVAGNYVDISATGVAINGMPSVLINSGGGAGSGTAPSPKAPTEPTEAKKE